MSQVLQGATETAIAFAETGVGRLASGERGLVAGSGHPVVMLVAGQSMEPTRFQHLIAGQCQLFLVSMPDPAPSTAALGDMLAALGAAPAALICRGTQAGSGLRFALECPHLISHLVLIAPELRMADACFRLERPVLVLEGTRSETREPSVGQQMAALLPECYDVLVYDATSAMDTERPEAVAEVVGDFVARGGGFVVAKPTGPLLP